MIGYEQVTVRPYVPRPLRCQQCLRFGHPTSACKQTFKTCRNCCQEEHTKEDETCNRTKFCINCKNEIENNHSPMDKNCPIFLKQKELTAIKTIHKVDHKSALQIYNARHPLSTTTYSKIVANSPKQTSPAQPNTSSSTSKPAHNTINNLSTTPTINTTHQPNLKRIITSYADIDMDTTPLMQDQPNHQHPQDDPKLRIFHAKQNTLTKPLKSKEKLDPKLLNSKT
ncbi:uncharacterized protein LOC115629405 [Scaptodrosophila lebanonensis]|uniref:Uncharacterized protein LOC115629405 n=1 Tax=Drosophila lebanonensis TaxID=7225 RepID=A0A6J2TYY2_DROLE|nr:uncharacterized protein LOC115629405 [Scaptodrosophila lebanonensis]